MFAYVAGREATFFTHEIYYPAMIEDTLDVNPEAITEVDKWTDVRLAWPAAVKAPPTCHGQAVGCPQQRQHPHHGRAAATGPQARRGR